MAFLRELPPRIDLARHMHIRREANRAAAMQDFAVRQEQVRAEQEKILAEEQFEKPEYLEEIEHVLFDRANTDMQQTLVDNMDEIEETYPLFAKLRIARRKDASGT